MTTDVIRDASIEGYLPTVVLLDTQEFRVIQGIPADVDHREAIQNVVRRSSYQMREFFFGVQSSPTQITVGHFRPGQPTAFMEIAETPDGYSATAISSCEWWKVS